MTLTVAEMRAVARNVKFRDWTFRLGNEKFFIQKVCKDNYTGKPGQSFAFSFRLPEVTCEEEFVAFVMGKIEKIVLHETQEEFFYKNKRTFDPHVDNPRLWVDTSRLLA